MGKRNQIRTRCLRKILEEGTNSGVAVDLENADNIVQFKLLMELLVQYAAHKMARSSTPGKKD